MNRDLSPIGKADRDMECHPGDRQPTSPILPVEHIDASENGGYFDENNRDDVVIERTRHLFVDMNDKADERPLQLTTS